MTSVTPCRDVRGDVILAVMTGGRRRKGRKYFLTYHPLGEHDPAAVHLPAGHGAPDQALLEGLAGQAQPAGRVCQLEVARRDVIPICHPVRHAVMMPPG